MMEDGIIVDGRQCIVEGHLVLVYRSILEQLSKALRVQVLNSRKRRLINRSWLRGADGTLTTAVKERQNHQDAEDLHG